MRTLKVAALAFVLAACAARGASAQSAAGSTALDFLNLDVNARPVALGGAYTALATDANALLYNPGGLGFAKTNEANFMHNQYVQGLYQEYLGFNSKQGWGVNVDYLNMGGLPRTTFSHPDGAGGNFGISDMALGGGYGRAFGPLGLGAGLKILHEQIDNVSGSGFAVDAGALYSVPQVKGLNLGFSLQNLGPSIAIAGVAQKLPTQLRAGAAYSLPALGAMHTLAFDLNKDRFDQLRLGFGFESVIGKAIAVRLGYTTRYDTGMGITAGVGWNYNAWAIDYAIVPMGDLGLANRFSLTYRWGGEELPREAATPSGKFHDVLESVETPEKHFALADKLIDAKKCGEARVELEKAVALVGPEDRRRALYYERMGQCAYFEGNCPSAKALFGA